MKSSYQLCTLFGIPIRLDISLIVLFFLLIANYGDPLYGIGAGLALLVSIALHELGHSLVAMAFGCRVRDITLMMIGGAATLLSMPRRAWQEFLVAAAGPLVSLVLGLAGILFFPPLVHVPSGRPTFSFFMHYSVGALNIGLFLFNLIPAFPMDGGRILRAILQQFFMGRLKATWVASRIGRGVAILMALSVVWSLLSGQGGGYKLIRLLIAWFIYQSAEREYLMVAMEEGDRFGRPGFGRAPFGGMPFGGGFGGGPGRPRPDPGRSRPGAGFARTLFGAFFRRGRDAAPEDDGKAVVSPPPYDPRGGNTRVDVHRENR